MIDVEELLKPLAEAQPCGPDLSYDARMEELEAILKGKPEVEIGNIKTPAEPPNWVDLQKKSSEFLRQSKHLRVVMMLCCSQLKIEGLAGFRDGLRVLRGLLEKYWAGLYPVLDPEDNNDPTQRLNILSALVAPRGSLSSWLAIVDYLYAAPLCEAKGVPPVTFEQIVAAKLRTTGADGAPAAGPGLEDLAAIVRGNPDQLAASRKCLEESLEAVQGIDQFLTSILTAGSTISFEELSKVLKEMLASLQSFTADQEPVAAGGAAPESAAAPRTGGPIRSREDVVRTLESICRYYQQCEPGSPVPYLLRRAQKLASMNFVDAMQELNLATPEALRPTLGSSIEAPKS